MIDGGRNLKINSIIFDSIYYTSLILILNTISITFFTLS